MRPLRREEVLRKVLHLFSGTVIPLAILHVPNIAKAMPFIPQGYAPWVYSGVSFTVATAIWILIDVIRIRMPQLQQGFGAAFGSMLRPEESKTLTGATWMMIASVICIFAFRNDLHIAAMVMCTFIWGDAAAALVGQSIGRIKIGKKSIEGSLGCLVVCLIAFLVLFPIVPGILAPWNGHMPLAIGISAALCITIMELFPITIGNFTINDNLIVPVATGALMKIMYTVLV